MKTRYWILLLAAVALLCGIFSVRFFLPRADADQAQILCDGQLLYTVDLGLDQSYPIVTTYGTNTVEVRDGAIAVTAADCPDGYCIQRGWCSSGADIVCLPHRLVIRFVEADLDLMTQ